MFLRNHTAADCTSIPRESGIINMDVNVFFSFFVFVKAYVYTITLILFSQ